MAIDWSGTNGLDFANLQRQGFWKSSKNLGLYVHIPFCARKCTYCDFNTYAGLQKLIPTTVDSLCREIKQWGLLTEHPQVDTLFLGGGTPSILSGAQMHQLMGVLHESFEMLPDCEITSEANPHSADQDRFAAMAACGINRISLGAQSFQAEELKLLGRWHDADAIGEAVAAARMVGFTNVNLDLMHGLPEQSLDSWAANLKEALELQVEHHSLYALTIEEGTPLARRVAAGEVPHPDADVAALQFQHAQAQMEETGFVHYEIANWARPRSVVQPDAAACRHNMRYWRNQNYLGFGPGAHSHWRGLAGAGAVQECRWWNLDSVPVYNRALRSEESPLQEVEEITEDLGRAETLMLSLRLVQEGMPYNRFLQRHGVDLRQNYGTELEHLLDLDLIQLETDRMRLTQTGIMFHNYVSRQFLPDLE